MSLAPSCTWCLVVSGDQCCLRCPVVPGAHLFSVPSNCPGEQSVVPRCPAYPESHKTAIFILVCQILSCWFSAYVSMMFLLFEACSFEHYGLILIPTIIIANNATFICVNSQLMLGSSVHCKKFWVKLFGLVTSIP